MNLNYYEHELNLIQKPSIMFHLQYNYVSIYVSTNWIKKSSEVKQYLSL